MPYYRIEQKHKHKPCPCGGEPFVLMVEDDVRRMFCYTCWGEQMMRWFPGLVTKKEVSV